MDVLLILGLILLNGLFSMSEMALISSRRLRLQKMADDGSQGARVALQLSEEPTRFLSTIQVGITLIGILLGAIGDQSLAKRLTEFFRQWPWSTESAESLGIASMVIIVTFLSLIFGELVPKRLALRNPEGISRVMAPLMATLANLSRPLVATLAFTTEAIFRLFRLRPPVQNAEIEEEIVSMVRQGADVGELEEAEHTMVRNVLRLDDLRIGNIMTLRREVVYLDIEDPVQENVAQMIAGGHYSVPVCRGDLDNLLGTIDMKAVLEAIVQTPSPDLEPLIRPVLAVPHSTDALELLERFRESRQHLAIVTDERGHMAGIVTLTDVMEAIVGDLPLGNEALELEFVQREDGSWLVDGQIDIFSFREHFKLKALPEEDSGEYHTLGGLVIHALGRIPRTGESLNLSELRIEVVDMDGNRVDKLLVHKVQREREDRDEDSLEAQSASRD